MLVVGLGLLAACSSIPFRLSRWHESPSPSLYRVMVGVTDLSVMLGFGLGLMIGLRLGLDAVLGQCMYSLLLI